MPPTIASNVYNPPPLDCDTDYDGFGNLCDGDFNNDAYVDASDFVFFEHDFQPVSAGGGGGIDSGLGTNMDCSRPLELPGYPASGGPTLTAHDFILFMQGFATGLPGPSGLACAGHVPCP
jgi:hypothetical protein